jgi:hypothetical protein
MLVSCSVENSYLHFGFKIKTLIDNYGMESIEVKAIESTTVEPLTSEIGTGTRVYALTDWEDLGLDSKSVKEDMGDNIFDTNLNETEKLSSF